MATRETPIKATLQIQSYTVRVSTSRTQTKYKSRADAGGRNLSLLRVTEATYSLAKSVKRLLQKLKLEMEFDPATLSLGIFPREIMIPHYIDPCTFMFTAGHFTIANSGNSIDAHQ